MNSPKRLSIIAIILASVLSGCTQNSAVKESVDGNGTKWFSTVRAKVAEMQMAAKKQSRSEKISDELGKRQKLKVVETIRGEEALSSTKVSSHNSTASEIAEERNTEETVPLFVSESAVEPESPQPAPQPQPTPPEPAPGPDPVPEPDLEPEPPAPAYYYAEYIPEDDTYFFTYEEEAIAWVEEKRNDFSEGNFMEVNGYTGWSGGSMHPYNGTYGYGIQFY